MVQLVFSTCMFIILLRAIDWALASSQISFVINSSPDVKYNIDEESSSKVSRATSNSCCSGSAQNDVDRIDNNTNVVTGRD